MAKPKRPQYQPFGKDTATYGWAGSTSSEFAQRMKLAGERFCKLKEIYEFDAIAFAGSSGCAVAFCIAAKHNIPLIYVRKKYERSHSQTKVECNSKTATIKKYLIVDDFIDTGSTVGHIVDSIKKHASHYGAYPAEAVGVLCFDAYQRQDTTMWLGDNESFPIFTSNKVTK